MMKLNAIQKLCYRLLILSGEVRSAPSDQWNPDEVCRTLEKFGGSLSILKKNLPAVRPVRPNLRSLRDDFFSKQMDFSDDLPKADLGGSSKDKHDPSL